MPKTPTASTTQRSARLQLEKVGDQQLLNVSVPRDVSSKDFARIGDEIIKIIKSHTGCTCLSGVIPVVLGNELKEAITVDLEVRA